MPLEMCARPLRAVGYLRVSSQEQVASGAGLAAQQEAIVTAVHHRGWVLTGVVSDLGVSGKEMTARPGLHEALNTIRAGDAQVLVVSKLDRLSRSLLDFSSLMTTARDEGWLLVALDLGIDLSTPAGEFLANVMASAAQWERRIIGQRTKDALAAKKAAGVRLGRPTQLPNSVVDRITSERALGSTLGRIAEHLNRDGVPTAQNGARWYPSTIRAVLLSQAARQS